MITILQQDGLLGFRSKGDSASKLYLLMQQELNVHFCTFLTKMDVLEDIGQELVKISKVPQTEAQKRYESLLQLPGDPIL